MKTHPALPIIASVPALGFAVLLAFAFVVKLQIGHWPSYSHPDPKQLDMSGFFEMASLAFVVSIAATVLIPILLGVCALVKWKKWKVHKRTTLILAFSIYAIGVALWIADLSFGQFTDWLLD